MDHCYSIGHCKSQSHWQIGRRCWGMAQPETDQDNPIFLLIHRKTIGKPRENHGNMAGDGDFSILKTITRPGRLLHNCEKSQFFIGQLAMNGHFHAFSILMLYYQGG